MISYAVVKGLNDQQQMAASKKRGLWMALAGAAVLYVLLRGKR